MPDTDHGPAIPATVHALAVIRASWQNHAAAQRWPRWVRTIVDKLPAGIQTSLLQWRRRAR